MKEIVGTELSSVEFVRDYIQLRWDGSCLTTLTAPSVRVGSQTFFAFGVGWRDQLCALIGHIVHDVGVTPTELVISFGTSGDVIVSLRDEDYLGPEAINYITAAGQLYVV